MEEYPSNSRHIDPPQKPQPAISQKPADDPQQPKLEKVVSGKVIRRKKTFLRRLHETFFSSDPNSEGVVGYIVKQVVVPAFQDMAVRMVREGIEKTVYGHVRTPNSSTPYYRPSAPPMTRVSYNNVSPPQHHATGPMRRPNISQPSSSHIPDVVLDSHFECEQVVNALFGAIQEFGYASVANLNQALEQASHQMDYRHGWYDVDGFDIRPAGHGNYRIVVPTPVYLR